MFPGIFWVHSSCASFLVLCNEVISCPKMRAVPACRARCALMAPLSLLSLMLLALLASDAECRRAPSLRGRLVVTKVWARNLKGDLWGRTEAYVKLWYGNSRALQSYMIHSNNPTWNQDFNFGYVVTTKLLRLELWDKDLLHDDLLAGCNFYLWPAKEYVRICRGKRGTLYFKYSLTVWVLLSPTLNRVSLRVCEVNLLQLL